MLTPTACIPAKSLATTPTSGKLQSYRDVYAEDVFDAPVDVAVDRTSLPEAGPYIKPDAFMPGVL